MWRHRQPQTNRKRKHKATMRTQTHCMDCKCTMQAIVNARRPPRVSSANTQALQHEPNLHLETRLPIDAATSLGDSRNPRTECPWMREFRRKKVKPKHQPESLFVELAASSRQSCAKLCQRKYGWFQQFRKNPREL